MALDVAYYYPAPYWHGGEGDWIKSLLLFFDAVAILLPDYMYGRHAGADPTLVEPLEDQGLLQILNPNDWVDQTVTEELASLIVELLTTGAFDDLPPDSYFTELSYSRMGYGADVELSTMLVEELQAKNLARPTEDGVSIPLHPVVRTTILVLLAQLSRAAGERRGFTVHPATNEYQAIHDLVCTLGRESFPSAGHVVTFDLEAVTLNLESVPLDDVLAFRESEHRAHKTYMRNLRGFLSEVANADGSEAQEVLLLERREEMADAAHDLRRIARRAFARTLGSWSLGLAGAAWSGAGGDLLSLALSGGSLASGALPKPRSTPTAFSYIFEAARRF